MAPFGAIVLATVAGLGAAPASAPGSLLARFDRVEAHLDRAVAAVRGGALPPGFDATVVRIDRDVGDLGRSLPRLGSGAARGRVVYYRLRAADTAIGLALNDVADRNTRASRRMPSVRKCTHQHNKANAELSEVIVPKARSL